VVAALQFLCTIDNGYTTADNNTVKPVIDESRTFSPFSPVPAKQGPGPAPLL